MPRKEVVIGIIFLVIIIIISAFGIQVDHKYEKGSLAIEENRAVKRFYAPFYVEIEFDLKSEPVEGEEYNPPEFCFNVLTDTDALSFHRIPVDNNKIEKGEIRHYKVTFATSINKHNSKSIDIVVVDDEGNTLIKANDKDRYNANFLEVGVESKDENIKIMNVKYNKGGIIVHSVAKLYYVALLFILSLIVIPRIEGKIINENNLKKTVIKFISLTVADLVILLNIIIFNLFGANKILDYCNLAGVKEVIVNNKLFVEIICAILLIGIIRRIIYEYRREETEKTNKSNFALKYILQLIVHFVFIIVAIIAAVVIKEIIEGILGSLAAIFVIIILGLRSVASMSTEEVVGSYVVYHMLPKD